MIALKIVVFCLGELNFFFILIFFSIFFEFLLSDYYASKHYRYILTEVLKLSDNKSRNFTLEPNFDSIFKLKLFFFKV